MMMAMYSIRCFHFFCYICRKVINNYLNSQDILQNIIYINDQPVGESCSKA